MKTKCEIAANWLPRYTCPPLKEFGECILQVNFSSPVRMFAKLHRVPVRGEDCPMPNATANGISIVNFGKGSASAATVMDLLGAVTPQHGACSSANTAG
jgi:AMP nucleosidase